jgi:HPt (histidine-containing phosphotransfer) domain-containing protein
MTNIFDLDAALRRVDGDRSLLGELAGIYLDEVGKLEIVISRALGQNDVMAATKAAHTLKGACATFCCSAVYDAAWALEQMRPLNTAEEITAASEKLFHESERLKQALREEFAI